MKKQATGRYSLLQAALWGIYGILFTYANRYLLDTGLSNTATGVIIGAATALSFGLQPALTAVVDRTRLQVRDVILISGGIIAACVPGLLLSQVLWLTVLLYGLSCVALQLLPSFVNALGMSGIRSGMKVNFGLSRGIGSVFFAVTAQLSNLLITRFGMQSIPVFTLLFSLLLLAGAVSFPHGDADRQPEETASGTAEFIRRNPRFFLFLLGTVLLYVGHNVLSNCMYQIASYKGNADAQGTAVMVAAVVELPTMFLFTRLLRWKRCDVWVCLSGIFFTLRIVLTLLLPGVPGLYAAQLTQLLGFALFAVSSVYYVGSVIPKRDVVKGQTYLGAANTVGSLAASVYAGAMIDAFGVGVMLLVCAAVSAMGMFIVFFSAQRVAQTAGAEES